MVVPERGNPTMNSGCAMSVRTLARGSRFSRDRVKKPRSRATARQQKSKFPKANGAVEKEVAVLGEVRHQERRASCEGLAGSTGSPMWPRIVRMTSPASTVEAPIKAPKVTSPPCTPLFALPTRLHGAK